MKRIPAFLNLVLLGLLSLVFSGCVHEFPEFSETIEVRLTVHHDLTWTEYDHYLSTKTKTRAASGHTARYVLYAYPAGTTDKPAHKFTFNRDDITLQDFTTSISLPPGKWDIYAWQDLQPAEAEAYYDVTDFSKITHSDPYRGDNENREGFEGHLTVEVPETYIDATVVEGRLDMERPMGRYIFIATDFAKFYNETLTRAKKVGPDGWSSLTPGEQDAVLAGYSIVGMYPFYMPYVYNQFTQRVTDSRSGMRYDARIRPLNGEEAMIASDHVFMNHHESGAQVQLALRTPKGETMRLTDVITVPMKRGQITYVRGNFLTAGVGNGLEIDFEFSGDINIKIP